MFQCKFCENCFSNKSNLKIHQKRAKYCLKIQGKEEEKEEEKKVFKCPECKRELSTYQRLQTHYTICVPYQTNLLSKKLNEEFEKEKIRKDKIILNQKKLIKELKENVKSLQKQLENVAIKAVSRPSYTSNKNIQINNYIQNMQPLCLKDIKESVPMLTLDHHVKGPEGYAEYALEFPFKDKIVCVDVSRNKIKYKNEEGDVIEDVGFRKMMMKLCDALKDRSYKLCQDHYEKLLDKFSEEEMDNTDFDFMEAAKAIHKYANGRESEFCNKIIKLISKGVKG
jgi:hypothetical protein